MDALRISETETDLPMLLDRAAAGETLLITRDGEAIAELRPAEEPKKRAEALDRLVAGLAQMPISSVSSVELLRRMYEEDDIA